MLLFIYTSRSSSGRFGSSYTCSTSEAVEVSGVKVELSLVLVAVGCGLVIGPSASSLVVVGLGLAVSVSPLVAVVVGLATEEPSASILSSLLWKDILWTGLALMGGGGELLFLV